jgi:hypothetical protein
MRGIVLLCRHRATGEERTGQALLPPPSASEQAPQTETVFGDDSTLFSLTKKILFHDSRFRTDVNTILDCVYG